MFDPESLSKIRDAIYSCTMDQKPILDETRAQLRGISSNVRTIRPRSTTSVSLVASDGGNNKLVFDPFYVQLVRVVNSKGMTMCFDAIAPTTDTDKLSSAQFDPDGKPKTCLGKMMRDLGVRTLNELSPMIPMGKRIREHPNQVSRAWVLVYRDICEWAVLYDYICYTRFPNDTLIVRDGLLRSKMFQRDLFIRYRKQVEESIQRIYREDRCRVFLVGLAKHSNVLTRYKLAMALEDTFPAGDARFVRIPRQMEEEAYVWQEWARGAETEGSGGELPKFVAGDMYLVRFGPMSGDPIWAVDLFSSQTDREQEIFGYLLADAKDGFPIPYYPRCLQKADEYAQVAGLDVDILQDMIHKAVTDPLSRIQRDAFEGYKLAPDLTGRRYD
jgi:hypothetical protein